MSRHWKWGLTILLWWIWLWLTKLQRASLCLEGLVIAVDGAGVTYVGIWTLRSLHCGELW